jgi:hypothetical protein
MDKIQDVIPEDKQPELLDSIQKVRQSRGSLSIRAGVHSSSSCGLNPKGIGAAAG